MKRFTWGKIIAISFVISVGYAHGAVKMSGHAEGGFLWQKVGSGGAGDTGMALDHVALNVDAEVTKKTSIHIRKGLAFNSNNVFSAAAGAGLSNNTSTYFNPAGSIATNAGGVGGTGFQMAVNEVYIKHKCSANLSTTFGMTKTPFGIEGMMNRYDYLNYNYSAGYNAAVFQGYHYGLGLTGTISGVLPGELVIAVLEGRQPNTIAGGTAPSAEFGNPGVAARWHAGMDAGSLTLTPVASVYAARFQGGGGPNTMGLSGGLKASAGAFALAAEFVRSSFVAAPGGALAHTRSIWVEPSFDAGMATLSAKLDLARTAGANATHLSAAITKNYDDWRARITYQLTNLSGGGIKAHDLRFLMGTTF